jgi:amino acid adenylation domain-containing protein/thioester reductase-like protein
MKMQELKYYELTHPQKSIWLIEQFYPSTNINHIGGALKILQHVDFEVLNDAVNLYIEKNEEINIQLHIDNGEPKQYYVAPKYQNLKVSNINKSEFEKYIDDLSRTPMPILDSPLYHFNLFKFEDGTGAILTFMHHIIADAWSINLCGSGIMTIYNALISNQNIDNISFPKYSDFIESEKQYCSSDKYASDKEYWEGIYSNSFDVISFKKNPIDFSTKFARKTFEFSKPILENISAYFAEEKLSLPSFFFSIYSLYFNKLFGTKNFVIGNPILNRSNFAEKNMFGMFISTVPFRTNYSDDNTFVEYSLDTMKEQSLMYRHIKYPYSQIADYIKEKKSISSKLYDVIFSYQVNRSKSTYIGIPYDIQWIPCDNQIDSLMIHLTDINDTGNLSVNYDYLMDVFSEKEIELLHERIMHIINQVINNKNVLCNDISIISDFEKNLLINEFNNTSVNYDKGTTIIKEFEKQVQIHPDNIAITFENNSLTYRELNNLANQFANQLLAKNLKRQDIVAIMLNRSFDLIIAILATLKIGATYMPIDPEYPEERIKYMINNSLPSIVVTTEELANSINVNNTLIYANININKSIECENILVDTSSSDLAYIMYTSGSTGNPKAVMIRNYSVINYSNSVKKRLDYTPGSNNKVLSVTTMCFDIFVFEVFPTLMNGLNLVVANEEQQKNPNKLCELINEQRICKILTTPSRIQLLFLNPENLSCLSVLKEIVLGGEPFPQYLLEKLPDVTNAKLFNLYGPTETTVYSTFKELFKDDEITIGKPIDNTKIYILDTNKKLLPLGSVGEIHIGGDGVASGYFKNLELTNEKFIKTDFSNHSIIYNTGDLGKWLPNGELICLGRTDNQIKIRGYRVELGDIESHILKYPGIDKVVVTDKIDRNGKKYLCAYFISEKDIVISDLHKFLVSYLPNYMIPSSFVKLDEFPLSQNHKIDRKALPDPTYFYHDEEIYVAPSTETEKILVDIMSKALNIDKLGIKDDIFNYSADSLTIINIQTLLMPYGWKFKTQDFYKLRTIESLAKLVDKRAESNVSSAANMFLDTISVEASNELIKINDFIGKNVPTPANINDNYNYNNIFLTGSTGYLGIHILHDIIQSTNAFVYCPIRNKANTTCKDRLRELWDYYFNDEKIDFSRIIIIPTDLTLNNLGLYENLYNELGRKVDVVINSAAIVKYYGDYSNFEKTNVNITKQLIKFCTKFNIKLNHISTLGVSGNYLVSHDIPNLTFTENNFFIGQNFKENVYIHSKFEAEKVILENRINGLNATIYRVGNLTGRFSDGVFQKNINENAFYSILKFIIKYRIVPKEMLNQNLEFTPVDLCTSFIMSLLKLKISDNRIFHLYNNKTVPMETLIELLDSLGVHVELLSADEFNERVTNLSNDPASHETLKAVINDLDSKKGLSFMPSVITDNQITNSILHSLDLNWPEITADYIKRIIEHMENCKFIDSKN